MRMKVIEHTSRRWGEGCVHWKEYCSITISTIVAGGALFAYVLGLHASQQHPGAASSEDLQAVDNRLTRQETRHADALRRIEAKLDDLAKDRR